MERKQFTFYRSFYDAIGRIRKKSARAEVYDAMCRFALNGTPPELEGMTGEAAVALTLILPVLESGIRKARNIVKTNAQHTDNIASTCDAHTTNIASTCDAHTTNIATTCNAHTTNKKEKEIEIENKCEIDSESDRLLGAGEKQRDFDLFWQAYPKKVGKKEAYKVFAKVTQPAEALVEAIQRQKGSEQWSRENGRFIPNPATWLSQQRWEDELPPAKGVPKGASGRLGKAELENIQRMLKEVDS